MSERRGMNIYQPCPYCGAKMNVINLDRHKAKCLDGPLGERVFDFLKSLSVNNRIPSRRVYDSAHPKDLPNSQFLVEWAGGWKQLARRLGFSVCRNPECGSSPYAIGLCRKCYKQAKGTGVYVKVYKNRHKCLSSDCDNPAFAKGICRACYDRIRRASERYVTIR